MHFMFATENFDHLITALYVRGDPFETSDAVFGVKQSLIVDIDKVKDKNMAEKYGVSIGCKLLTWHFVLVSKKETDDLRDKLAREAMEKLNLGRRMTVINGLPVPDVD